MKRITLIGTLAGLAFALASAGLAAAPVVLRASHQFPGGKGDVRDEMVQIIARDAKAAGVDLEVQVYPGASLFKPNEQWNALVNGQLDISSFPLDYASGKVREFGATLMPGLVRSHDRAQRLNDSQFMKDIRAKIEKSGVIVLSDAWLAGAVASKKGCIRAPADIKGLKIRSAGPTFAAMWQAAGASIVSVPSNEVYNALQTGVADATDTSSGSFVSFRIYEQVKCITAPGDNALWFMYEPVLMSKKSFDRLDKKQQDVLRAAGKKAQEYFAKEAKGLDDEMVKVFKQHNVEVVTLSPAEYDQWIKVAQQSSYAEFAKEVPDGKKLIDEALSAKEVFGASGAGLPRRRPGTGRRRAERQRVRSLHRRGPRRFAALRLRRRRARGARRRHRLPHGHRPLRAEPEHDLADRPHHLLHNGGDVHRQPLRAADARARQRERAPASSRAVLPLRAGALRRAHFRRLLRRHDRDDVPVLEGGVGQPLGVGHDVARAAVDSVLVDAHRPRASHAAVRGRHRRARDAPRGAVRPATERVMSGIAEALQ